MARLIPKVKIEEILVKPERDVAKALTEQLPHDVTIYHSYPWLRGDRNDRDGSITLNQGEADFVIVDPDCGLLVVEVKGGEIVFNSSEHIWERVLSWGHKEIKNPFEQARRNMHYLVDEISKEAFPGTPSPFVFGYCVVFPDCDYKGTLPMDAEASIIFTAKDLDKIGKRVRSALRGFDRRPQPRPLDKQVMEGIIKGLSPNFQLLPVLYRQLEEQEEWLVRLTEDQIRVLDVLQTHARAAIEGVAGSGKTMLACSQAQRFADKGLRTLFVCFNKALADWVRDKMSESYAEKITVRHFHGLCHDMCRKTGIKFDVAQGKDAEEFWRHKAPELLIDAASCGADKFDAIVVDEAQDFDSIWWMALTELETVPGQGPFYVFYDPAQNLFNADGIMLPELGLPFRLPTNCRNTRRIANFCSSIKDIPIPTRKETPEGQSCFVHPALTAENQLAMARDCLKKWIREGSLQPSQIVMLSPHTQRNSPFAGTNEISGVKIVDSLEKWRNNEGILFTTIRSFKGLEAAAVLMVDIPTPKEDSLFTTNDFYVAASRPKHLLTILAKDGHLADRCMSICSATL